jgi:hypothetical protein
VPIIVAGTETQTAKGEAMISRALLAAFVVSFMAGTVSAQIQHYDIDLRMNPDRTAYLYNTTNTDIHFDGYQIAADTPGLDPVGWYSINDRIPAAVGDLIAQLGAGALGFGELNPTASQIAEGNLTGVGIFKAGDKISLGKPFGDGGYWVSLFFKRSGVPSQFDGGRYFIPRVPEPSTLLLATLASLGLVAMRVRSKD